jgi:CRISPR/Cas system CSM-associated protein Csm5 (group 7 of RAMP superfamily)
MLLRHQISEPLIGITVYSMLSDQRLYNENQQARRNTSDHGHRRKALRSPVQQHLPQQEIQKTGLSVQAPSSTNSDTLKIVSVEQQIVTELSKAVTEKGKIMIVTKTVLNLMKQNDCSSS